MTRFAKQAGILSATLLAALCLRASPSLAACNPAGNEGDVSYSSVTHIMQYCNGTTWVSMGQPYSVGFGTLTTGDLCAATSGTQISCSTVLVGDVTTAAGTVTTTVAKIHGTTVSGTTGTGNVAFSASPTFTGTVTGAASNWSGSVGIGTASPQATLQVQSGQILVPNGSVNAPSVAVGTSNTGIYSVGSTGLGLGVNGSDVLDYGISTSGYLTASEPLKISYLGAGTAPLQVVQVGATGTTYLAQFLSPSMNAYNVSIIPFGENSSTDNEGILGFQYVSSTSTSNNIQIGFSGNTNLLNLAATGTMTLTGSGIFTGSVGIGTTSPGTSLDVYGTVDTRARVQTSDANSAHYTGFQLANGAGTPEGGMFLQNSNKTVVQFWSNSGDVLNLSGSNVGIGTTSPNAGAVLDLSANTNSMLLPVGTQGQEPSSPVAGMIRYDSTISNVEYYNGSAWTPFRPSGPPPGAGNFVLTATHYAANFGGISSANADCLTDLTTNTGWWGYTQANATGRLTSSKVFAFLCDGTTCNNLQASTAYYFANSGDNSAGGASFTTNSSGFGPNDSLNWARADHFGGETNTASGCFGSCRPWTGRSAGTNTLWNGTSYNGGNCSAWTSTAGTTAATGDFPNVTTSSRWSFSPDPCTLPQSLICFVNP